jgi:hypothetical protein
MRPEPRHPVVVAAINTEATAERADGLREGRADGLRATVVTACELLGIVLTDAPRVWLNATDVKALDARFVPLGSATKSAMTTLQRDNLFSEGQAIRDQAPYS